MSEMMKAKEACRNQAEETLLRVDTRTRCAAGRSICESLVQSEMYKTAKIIGMYMALGREVGLAGLMQVAWQDGKTVCVPCRREGEPHYEWGVLVDGASFVKGPDGVMQPAEYDRIGSECVDLVLVPGLSFSTSGVRLGRGGGFYDRLLADCAGLKAGIAFGAQVVPELPAEPHDVAMDLVVSEERILRIDNNTETMRRN